MCTRRFTANKIIGCPHPHIPSDHMPLMVNYALLPSKYVENPHAFFGTGASGQRGHVQQVSDTQYLELSHC